jgi:pantetheine-phosphate adenylyltransferase
MNFSNIVKRLVKLGFPESVLQRYNEPHRYYHTTEHLLHVLDHLARQGKQNDDLLFLAAVYHDAVYDPRRTDNEDRSAKLFAKDATAAGMRKADIELVSTMIRDTKSHVPSVPESVHLIEADIDILDQPLETLIKYEHQTYREYQYVSYNDYKAARIKVLGKFNSMGKLDPLFSYIKHRRLMTGVFCGSFNPFHRGHYNILQKAERIFDKVIIAFGKNPEKDGRNWEVPQIIRNRQIEEYSGLLTDFISSLGEEVVVIRGLRNSTDFQYEQNQYRYIQELMPEIRIVNIFCDKEFEHISSSGIRTLEKFGKHKQYLLE